jgi:GTP-binding protein
LPSAGRRSSSKKSDGNLLEPIEQVFVEVHKDYLGAVQEMLGRRRAEMQTIHYGEDGTVYGTYLAPTRGCSASAMPFLTATRGTGIYHTLFHAYEAYKGDIALQVSGALGLVGDWPGERLCPG